MDNISFAEALEPDVIQYIVQGARDAGITINSFLRESLGVRSAAAPMVDTDKTEKGSYFVTSPTGVVVEIGCVTDEQMEHAREVLNFTELAKQDPDELLRIGRENWAREHGY